MERKKTYTWRFTPADGNYAVLTGTVRLYQTSGWNGGSGGSGVSGDSAQKAPSTGDAGLLAYGVMALSGYTGAALLLRRRKRED